MEEDNPDPQKIGELFVMQYYTQMHKDPSQMHRFYLANSIFTRGGPEMGTVTPVVGQQAIHEKIQSLGLQKVHTRIRQVDSNSTVLSTEKDHAILIQVTGELSIAGHPMRPFVQTFVLGLESPKKYYIHNDIFRYQIYDEDFVSETDDTNEVQIETEPVVEGNSAELVPPTDHTHTDEGGDDVVSEPSVKGSPAPPVTTEVLPTTNSWSDRYEAGTIVNSVPDETDEGPVTTSVPPAGGSSFTNATSETDEIVNDDQNKPKDTSWASKLKAAGSAGKTQSSSNPLPSSANKQPSFGLQSRGPNNMVNSTQPLPQREPKQSRIKQQDSSKPLDKKPPLTTPTLSSAPSSVPLTRSAPDSHQVFVGNLPNGTKEDELKEIFKKYGNVIEVRINPKNFGFIVFDSEEPVQTIIASRAETTLMLHDRKLNIEEKRPSSFQKTMGGSGSGGFSSGRKFPAGSGGMFSGGNKYSRGTVAASKPPPRR
ncbi:PREDICTED: ras GTPase-activating protein-binding protein 1-like isoform X1 [Amphimedon queenslandica]|uniref:Uncharacterized protein n=1 Tax=Amphimedon queenslandica TaxID=400682 RepID=A0A1X7VNZ5_AMPQE|nr:PREDICTED: ras GTPase-activating protein-binding protein 1-like isoform X1 [Amphimedon queenslandica]|eukprot:XP_019860730.1 PREDICTED: ras GTPase-activating protein-binding protein 1-like isoform X1 [Amphimedon queenslandica]